MSNTPFKGSLSVAGPSFDKSKMLRRPTPDSDVLASSDEDRDHPPPLASRQAPGSLYPGGRRPSSGWLQDIQPNRKFSLPSVSFAGSQPTTPALEIPPQPRPSTSAFPWNTSSFSSAPGASRMKEMIPSPTSTQPPSERLPPNTHIEDDGIGFLLNQQTSVRKSVRSQSYSIGQADIENSPAAQFSTRLRTSLRHRPSKPSMLGDQGLSQLREDEHDDVESSNGSEHGVRLPPGYWEREQKQALLKQAAMENARSRQKTAPSISPVSQQRRQTSSAFRNPPRPDLDHAIEDIDGTDLSANSPHLSLTRRFSEHVSLNPRKVDVDPIVDSPKKPKWATENIDAIPADYLGRRHSLATYAAHASGFQMRTLSNTQEEDENVMSPQQRSRSPVEQEPYDTTAYFTGYGPASRAINASAISAAHPDPHVPHSASIISNNPYAVPSVFGRPARRLFVVTFKCSRADVFYLFDNTGLEIRRGDLVIVEGDRGSDLGQVTHADISLENAKKHKAEANTEHFRWLVMFSQYSLAGASNDGGMLGALARARGFPNTVDRSQLSPMGAQQDQDSKPRMIKRLAQQHEIVGLRDKEGLEAKAKRLAAQKAVEHKLPMEILDAEYQADMQKLTYFYYADAYVNFNPLVAELFKQYKLRIWMSAVNPASVVNPAGTMQSVPPPSAIGPGAIINTTTQNVSPPVGPGFGNQTHRQNEYYGRGRTIMQQNSYSEGYYPFSHQLPNYPSQPAYHMPQWGQSAQDMYSRYGAFPLSTGGYSNTTTRGSPMNYGGYYPPTTYSSSPLYQGSSGASYGGSYVPTSGPSNSYTSYASANPTVSTAGPAYNAQYTTGRSAQAMYTTAPSYGSQYGSALSNPQQTYGSGISNTQQAYGSGRSNAQQTYGSTLSNAPQTYGSSASGNVQQTYDSSAFSNPQQTQGSSNGYTNTSTAGYSSSFDPAVVLAMQNLDFGK
ncbi:hypothetical protein BDV95DRAFT_336618 [Massariosphaeria phaeospora]|uniref:PSP1 C-terminal domain-containing protein n=1 Tax=Massariosphaeria phaeospora TaxID=100035 RepID=A0A7C8MC77_9PLEO|nr:hypothetical protein BDV95DRAFT_336618 [Massariosphaeria phaeospora]